MPADDDEPGRDPGPWGQPGSGPARPKPQPVPEVARPGRPAPWTPGPRRPGDFGQLGAQALGAWDKLLGGGGAGSHGPGSGYRQWLSGGRGVALVALVFAGLWLTSGIYRVQPDEEGAVQRFGKFVRLTPPGLNYHAPWPIESVQLPAVTRINRVEIGYRSPGADQAVDDAGNPISGARQVGQESLMLTGDENIIDINFAVFWRVGDAARYLYNTRDPEVTIKAVAESVMREVIGRTPIQPALTDARARIEADVLAKSQAILDRYGAGVELTQVQLQKVDPPAEVIDSFRDVQRANTEAERMVNEAQSYANNVVPRARGDAAVITAAGDGARQASVARATGEAQHFTSVLEAYQLSKDVTLKRLYIETMQEVLTHAPALVVDSQMKNLVPLLSLGATPAIGATP